MFDMHKIFEIIKKNLRLLVKSKGSALVVILGPLLLIFLAGIAFDNYSAYRINIGIYSPEYTPLINSFIQKLDTSQFRTMKFDSETQCVESISQGKAHTCVVFPKNMDLSGNKTNTVTFYVDYSKVNLVWMVRDTLFAKISERATEISTELTDVLLGKIRYTIGEINAKKPTLTELSTDNTKTAQDIISIKTNLNALDLSINKESFNIAELRTKTEKLNELGKDAVNKSISTLDSISSTISSPNMNMSSGERESILSLISSAKSDLNDINEQLSSSYGTNASSVLSLISSVESKLDETKQKFEKASKTRTDVSQKIDSIKALLDSDLTKIAALQSSFNSIAESLGSAAVQSSEAIVSPVTTLIKPVTTKSYLGYMFPILLVMLTMFVSIILSTTLIMTEKKSAAYFRNLITPTSDVIFFISAYLTNMLLIILQIIIMLLISIIFFKARMLMTLPATVFLLLLSATLFTLIGISIGYLFKSEETATLGAISVSSILLLLSSVVLPIESMPHYVMAIAKFNPFVISESLLRKAIIFETPLFKIDAEVGWLILYIILFATAIIFIQTFTLKTRLRQHAKILIPKKIEEEPALKKSSFAFLMDKFELHRMPKGLPTPVKEIPEQQKIPKHMPEKRLLTANTLAELIEMLEKMDDEEFSQYSKEEFSAWVRQNIKEDALAEKILKTESRTELEQEFRAAYERHLRRIEELKKRIAEKKRKLNKL